MTRSSPDRRAPGMTATQTSSTAAGQVGDRVPAHGHDDGTGGRRVAMTTDSRDADRACWTALGVQMGFTSRQPQREEILDAIDRMTWVQTPARPPYLASLDGQAVRAIVT